MTFVKVLLVGTAWVLSILAVLWVFVVLSGFGMGTGGRSSLHLIAFLGLGVALPTIATIAFARRAAKHAQKNNLGLSLAWLLAAICPIPALYVGYELGLPL